MSAPSVDLHVFDANDVDRMERLAGTLPDAELVAVGDAARVLELRRSAHRTQPRADAEIAITTRASGIEVAASTALVHLAGSALPGDWRDTDLSAFDALFTPGPFTEFLGGRHAPSFAVGVTAYDALPGYDRSALRSTLGLASGRRVVLCLVDGPDDPLKDAALALTTDFELLLCGDVDPGDVPGALSFPRERARLAVLFAVSDAVIGAGERPALAEAALIAQRPTVCVGPVDERLGAVTAVAGRDAPLGPALEEAFDRHEERAAAREALAERWFAHRDGTASESLADQLNELAGSRRRITSFQRSRAAQKPNVVWVCVDGLRPDRLHCAPFMSELFSRGALFTNVHSAAAGTHTAMHSVFTSLYPANHRMLGWTKEALRGLDPRALSIADVLQNDGYSTLRYCDLAGEQACPKTGFEVWEHSGFPVGRALAQTGHTLDTRARRRFFERYAATAGPKFAYVHLELLHELNCEMGPLWSSAGYERNVEKMDANLRKVLDALPLEDGDLLVISTDHGAKLDTAYAEFERQAGPRHEEEAARTFTAFLSDDVAPRRVEGLVRSVDVVPTILDLVGASPLRAQGRSLLPALLGAESSPLWAYREKGAAFDEAPSPTASNTWSVRSERWKYTAHVSRPECEWLIDLREGDYRINHLGEGLDVEAPLREALEQTLIRAPESVPEIYARRGQELKRENIPPVLSIALFARPADPGVDRCAASLRAQVGPAHEILVLDPATEGLHAAATRARGRAVALALPDAEYDEEYVQTLWEALEARADCGAALAGYFEGDSTQLAPDPERATHLGPCLLLRSDVLRTCVASLRPNDGLRELHEIVARRERMTVVARPLARWSGPAPHIEIASEPLLSVLVPDHDPASSTRLADSVAVQTDPRVELVFGAQGLCDADRLNSAAHRARGDLFCAATPDVVLAPLFVASMRAALSEFPRSVAYSSFGLLSAGGRIESVHKEPEVSYRQALCRPPQLAACVYPRKAHEELGLFDARLEALARWDFLVRLLGAYELVHVPELVLLAPAETFAPGDAGRIRDLELDRRARTLDLARLYPTLTDSARERARACADFGRELLEATPPDPALAARFFQTARELDPDEGHDVRLPPDARRRFSAVTHAVTPEAPCAAS